MLSHSLMRTTFLITLLMLTGLACAQTGQVKKVTIELSNITLEEALTILSISYAIDFSYSDDVVPTHEIVNLSIKNEGLPAALDKLLNRFNLGYKITGKRVLIKKSVILLSQTIRGSIRDEITDVPLPGATILITKGNGLPLGSSSDSLGNFSVLNVPVGRISIIVSCIGYNTRILENVLLGTGKELFLDLKVSESITAIDEVVVTAQRKDLIPGGGVALTSGKSFTVEETKRYAGSLGDPARMVTAFPGITSAS